MSKEVVRVEKLEVVEERFAVFGVNGYLDCECTLEMLSASEE